MRMKKEMQRPSVKAESNKKAPEGGLLGASKLRNILAEVWGEDYGSNPFAAYLAGAAYIVFAAAVLVVWGLS